MIDIAAFKNTISLLNKNGVNYSVFGGFAFDGIRGQITRSHEDIDIYLDSNDLDKLKKIFSGKYTLYQKSKMYYVESENYKLGVVLTTNKDRSVIAHGNRTVVQSPSEIWNSKNIRQVDDIMFNCAPNEILVFDSQFSKYAKDKQLGSRLAYDKDLYSKISVI